MKTKSLNALVLAGLLAGLPLLAFESPADIRLGLGANYWKAIDDIDDDDFDEDGLSWIVSIQFGLTEWSKLEIAVERFDEGFGGSTEDVYAPQAFLILGKGLYAGVGIGGYYSDDEWADDPFYAFRAGFVFELLPSLFLDINANYRFENWDDIDEGGTKIDSDTITLGAAVRIGF